jgi:nicotinamidase-related amidase
MNRFRAAAAVGYLAIHCAAIVPSTVSAADPPGQLVLSLRKQVETPGGCGKFRCVEEKVAWEANKTAVIVCDMWAKHWCTGAVKRGAEMAPRMNELLIALRSRGVLVVHAPSGAMDLYKDHPARTRAQSAPKAANLPAGIGDWCNQIEAEKKGKYPVDQADGGCDDQPRCSESTKMDLHQAAILEIRDEDAISDSGAEVWNLFHERGIANVMLLGVHTNMCVLGRPFGLRNMARFGKNVALVRDLTDTMYNSRAWPNVSHFRGTELIVEHIEKYVCPTLTSDQILGGKPFRFAGDAK